MVYQVVLALGLDHDIGSGGIMDPGFNERDSVRNMNKTDISEIAQLYTIIPEPTTVLLFATGLAGIFAFGRKRLFKGK